MKKTAYITPKMNYIIRDEEDVIRTSDPVIEVESADDIVDA